MCIRDRGNVVDGDVIMYICGKYMKEQGTLFNNTVVTTIMSNFGLYKAFEREGIAYEKTAVGDKYVYENMAATGNCLGGEQSGHIIFSKHATTGDGILTSLKVMEVVLEKKQTLEKLASEVDIYPQVLKNVRVKDKKQAQDDEAVQAEVAKVAESLGTDGRILPVSYTHLGVTWPTRGKSSGTRMTCCSLPWNTRTTGMPSWSMALLSTGPSTMC